MQPLLVTSFVVSSRREIIPDVFAVIIGQKTKDFGFFAVFLKYLTLFLKCSAITLQNVHENCKQKKIFQFFFLILRFFSIFKWRERKISYRSLPASYFHWNKYLFGKFHSHSGQELHKSKNIRIDSQYFRHIFNMRLLGVTDL